MDGDGMKITTGSGSGTSFEDVLHLLGMPGWFQCTQLTMTFLATSVIAATSISYVFLGYEPPHQCNRVNESQLLFAHGLLNDSTATVVYRSCDIQILSNQTGHEKAVMTTSCLDGRNFSDAKYTTFLSEWDLVCESQGIAELSYTLFNLGFIVGGFTVSTLSDRYGRRLIFLISSFLLCLLEALVIAAPNIYFIYVIRFASGMCRQALADVYFIIGIEILEPRHRDTYGIVVCIKWVVDYIIVCAIAFALQNYNWRFLQGAIAAFGLLFIVYPFFLKESPRWLTSNNRFDETLAIFKTACKKNSVDFDHVKAKYHEFISSRDSHKKCENTMSLVNHEDDHDQDTEVEVMVAEGPLERGSLLKLICHKELLIVTMASSFIWFANASTYYGLFMSSSELAGDRFFNFGLMAFVELPSALLILVMLKRMKRLLVLRIFLGSAAVFLFASSLLTSFGGESQAVNYTITVLFILGKFAISSSFGVVYITTPEIYPTNMRAIGTAVCNSTSRIGSMLVPFIRPLIHIIKWGPGVIFTSFCLIALALTTLLPEMKGKNLPNSISDFEKISNSNGKRNSNNKSQPSA